MAPEAVENPDDLVLQPDRHRPHAADPGLRDLRNERLGDPMVARVVRGMKGLAVAEHPTGHALTGPHDEAAERIRAKPHPGREPHRAARGDEPNRAPVR